MIHDSQELARIIGSGKAELTHGHERYPLAIETRPPCSDNCPAGINVKGYVNLIANKRYEEALELIRDANPFPGICGRVCTHPCEANCHRSETENPLSIKALKRFVADYEVSRKPAELVKLEKRYTERIAVIGTGPGGLTTAVDLTRLGYEVTVFEAMPIAGGMMQWGIPEFRLPRDVLAREITRIESMGINIKRDHRIEDPHSLLSQGFAGVVMAIGAWKGLEMKLPGEDLTGVSDCLEFLRHVYSKKVTSISGTVIVIGGGDSAMDAARTALRLGAEKVIVAYRRTENEMPANKDEIREAKEEGVEIQTLLIPKSIQDAGTGKVSNMVFIKAELGEIDGSGRRRPIPMEGSELTISCDLVIPSIGAYVDDQSSNFGDIKKSERGLITVGSNFRTNLSGIYALGDAVRGPSTIVDVIGDAHLCAATIHGDLREQRTSEANRKMNATAHNEIESVRSFSKPAGIAVNVGIPATEPRNNIVVRSAEERGECFDEVEDVYPEFVARTEASRCNTCGPCAECFTCLPTCDSKQLLGSMTEDVANADFVMKVPCDLSRKVHEADDQEKWRIVTDGTEVNVNIQSLTPKIDPDLCIACGRCEEACAYRAVRVGLKAGGKVYSYIDHDVCRSCGRCVLVCPSRAIKLPIYGDDLLLERITRSIESNAGIAVIACGWAKNGLQGSGIAVMDMMCAVGVTQDIIIRALALGARGVLISHCAGDHEHYLRIDHSVTDVVEDTKELLNVIGMDPEIIHLTDSYDLKGELDEFRTRTEIRQQRSGEFNLKSSCPGRITQTLHDLYHLSSSFTGSVRSSVSWHELKGIILRNAGLPDNLSMIESARKLSELLEFEFDPDGLESHRVNHHIPDGSGTDIPQPSLMEAIASNGDERMFRETNTIVAVHICGVHDSEPFAKLDDLTKTIGFILNRVPGLEFRFLENGDCGNTEWSNPTASTREKAMAIYQEAKEAGASMIITPFSGCLTHLKACNRPGAWRHSSLEVEDIYSFIISCLKGGVVNE